VLYLPKDIVAGDFCWGEQVEGKVLFAAADCTRNGVPGATVSVVCHNALKIGVREYGLQRRNETLEKTREIVVDQFSEELNLRKENSGDFEVKDGMDVALCSLNRETRQLTFAGANKGLLIIRNGEVIEY
jgi:hypothetical protein